MNRYDILLNKIPEITSEETITVHQFGFEQDFQSKYKETQKKQRLFYVNNGETARIGIIHEEGQKDIFSGAMVHFYGKRRFFCKSTASRISICCSSTYSGNRPALRIAVPIIQYSLNLLQQRIQPGTPPGYEILPWVFGKIIYGRIKEMNDMWPVDQVDLFISNTNNNPFNQYVLESGGDSLWRQFPDKELILQSANSLRQNIMSYIAEDLNENVIESLLGQPPATQQERPIQPIRARNVSRDSLSEELDRLAELYDKV